MAMTRAELRTAGVSNIGARIDKNTVINTALDLGLKALARRHEWDDLRTSVDLETVATEQEVSLPSDFLALLEARYINGTISWLLEYKTKRWLVERWPNISANNNTKPEKFYVASGSMFLFPVPDAAYTIRVSYVAEPADFADDSTENPVSVLDLSLLSWATHYVMMSMENFAAAAGWLALSEKHLLDAIRSDKRTGVMHQADGGRAVRELPNPNAYLDPFAKKGI